MARLKAVPYLNACRALPKHLPCPTLNNVPWPATTNSRVFSTAAEKFQIYFVLTSSSVVVDLGDGRPWSLPAGCYWEERADERNHP